MYTYKYSAGRYKNYRPGYHLVDISGYSVANLEKLFDILYIVVYDDLYKKDISISLEDYRLDFAKNPTLTISNWLTTQNGNNLKSAKIFPSDAYSYVKLERVFTYGYFHYPADVNLANDRQDALLSDSAPDIRLAHYRYQNIDYTKINSYSLFTINGIFTRSIAKTDGIYLKGAGLDYIAKKNDIRIGALNFEKIGKVTTVPITSNLLIEEPLESDNVGRRYQYKLTGIKDKTIYLVLNGQLLVDDNIIYRAADDRVVINLSSFDVSHHYLNQGKYTRTPPLELFSGFEQYKKEALLMSNSFFVIIDNPTVGVTLEPLTKFGWPNAFHTEEKFQHPLVLDNGLFPLPYIRTYGRQQRLLNHDLRVSNRYPFMSSGALGGNLVVNPAVNQGNPGKLSKGWMFKIHGLKLETT
jgi:hypothetical protein